MDKIRAITKQPGGRPMHVWITPTLENLQRYVGGYIETLTIASDLVIICNEEGRLLGLPYTCTVCGADLVGDIIVCGVKGDEFADLPCSYGELKRLLPSLWENAPKVAVEDPFWRDFGKDAENEE